MYPGLNIEPNLTIKHPEYEEFILVGENGFYVPCYKEARWQAKTRLISKQDYELLQETFETDIIKSSLIPHSPDLYEVTCVERNIPVTRFVDYASAFAYVDTIYNELKTYKEKFNALAKRLCLN
ncbi:MAG: hypothetical protein AB4372_01500 [Xenococcus sp. (in: cyanobacteria)]